MIKVDAPKIKDVERQLGRFGSRAPTVISRAINRAVANAKSNMAKKTREQYIVKSKDIKETVTVIKATRSRLGALVKSTGYKVPLIKFRVSPKEPRPQKPPKAYKAKVRKAGTLKAVIGGFVADIKGNYRVMKREGSSRLPIKQLFGPSIPEMIGYPSVIEYIEKEAGATLERRIEHEVNRVLEAKL